jgi:hypothetical protein
MSCSANDDGHGQGILVREGDGPSHLAEIADQVQDRTVEELWSRGRPTTWPECPFHPGSHPLEPSTVVVAVAVWRCPKTATALPRSGTCRRDHGASILA